MSSTGAAPSHQAIPWRALGWGGAALLLAIPYVAGAPWTASDFVFMGVLFAIVGGAFELIVRASSSWAYRLGAAAAVVTGFLTIWVNAAVGMIGDGPYNLLFGGVLALALLGSIAVRFRPAGMARVLVAAAALQALLSVIGMSSDPRGGMLSLCFAIPWLVSSAFFRNAARNVEAVG